MLIEYDGRGFHGFQRQQNLVSVQETLEKAISLILKEPIYLKAAGRTDAGVHARGMVVSFQSSVMIENEMKFMISVNGVIIRTPLAVQAMMKMDDSFHARFSCTEREYEYWIANAPMRHPLLEERACWIKGKIDVDHMRENALYLLGRQHYTSFTPPLSLGDKSSERKITEVNLIQSEDFTGLLKFRIRGTGFLHNMIRIIAGTLIDIGRGRIKDRNMKEIIEAQDRNQAGVTLPPHGLYFIRAWYENYPQIESLYEKNRFVE